MGTHSKNDTGGLFCRLCCRQKAQRHGRWWDLIDTDGFDCMPFLWGRRHMFQSLRYLGRRGLCLSRHLLAMFRHRLTESSPFYTYAHNKNKKRRTLVRRYRCLNSILRRNRLLSQYAYRLHRNAAWLRFLALGYVERQNTVLVSCFDCISADWCIEPY